MQSCESSVESPMCELLQVSSVTLNDLSSSTRDNAAEEDGIKRTQISHSGPIDLTLTKTHLKLCPRCRRFSSADGALCHMCLSCVV